MQSAAELEEPVGSVSQQDLSDVASTGVEGGGEEEPVGSVSQQDLSDVASTGVEGGGEEEAGDQTD